MRGQLVDVPDVNATFSPAEDARSAINYSQRAGAFAVKRVDG